MGIDTCVLQKFYYILFPEDTLTLVPGDQYELYYPARIESVCRGR